MKKRNVILDLSGDINRDRSLIPLYKAVVKSHLEYYV